MSGISAKPISGTFKASAKRKKTRKARTPPVSIRFSDDERAALEKRAGDQPLGPYIKSVILADHGPARKPRKRMPVKDHEALARVLSMLGRSELGRMLGGILLAVKMGELDLDDETEFELRQACADITAMRCDLIVALGLRGQSQL